MPSLKVIPTKNKEACLFLQMRGAKWTRVSGDHRLIQRAWYYIEIALDPQDENTVYVMSAAPTNLLMEEQPGHVFEVHTVTTTTCGLTPLTPKI